jgi:hypothetical protein
MLQIGYRLTTVLAYPQSKNAETRSVDNNLLRANSQAALMLHRGNPHAALARLGLKAKSKA